MKKVYIVSDGQWIFGVFKTKDSAKKRKQEVLNSNWKGVVIKRRYNNWNFKIIHN